MKNLKRTVARILAAILATTLALGGAMLATAETSPSAAAVVLQATELKTGDRGDDVAIIQNALIAWDADALPKYGVDGFYGSETAAAIRAFQAEKELPATGICDAVTIELLLKNAEEAGVVLTAERSPAKRSVRATQTPPRRTRKPVASVAEPKPADTSKATQPPTTEATQNPAATADPKPADTSKATQPPAVDVTLEPGATSVPAPTKAPTAAPTKVPTTAPTKVPTTTPTKAPTAAPTKAPTAAPTEAPTAVPVCEHNWVENTTSHEVEEKGHYETVHHDAVTEERRVLVKDAWEENYAIYQCSCGASYKNQLGLLVHQAQTDHSGYSSKIGSIQHPAQYATETVVVQEAYDEQVWVVDEPAHTEQIPNGTFTCSKCGATK